MAHRSTSAWTPDDPRRRSIGGRHDRFGAHDFTVIDADRLLDAARRAYRELHPESDANDANSMVTCAADAIFTVLEHAGLIGDTADSRLAEGEYQGLALGGWRAEVIVNEPNPLRPGRDCLRTEDVFALPEATDDSRGSPRA